MLHQKVVNLSTSPEIIMSPHYLVKRRTSIHCNGNRPIVKKLLIQTDKV